MYTLAINLFLKLLAITYFAAFVSFGVQAKGLIGKNGILPLAEYIDLLKNKLNQSFWSNPSIFWFKNSDFVISVVWIVGSLAAVGLFFGFYTRLMLVVCFVMYLSIVNGGQDFMSFQWDILLLEVGFISIFISPSSSIIIYLFWFVLFKLMFMSGLVKLLSGDKTWRDLSALCYHYLTQPLPTRLAWHIHKLPKSIHKFSTGAMFAIELIIPFLFFVPGEIQAVAGLVVLLLMTLITLTGNYNIFTFLTASLTVFLFNNQLLLEYLPNQLIAWLREPVIFGDIFLNTYLIPVVSIFVVLISIIYAVAKIRKDLPTYLLNVLRGVSSLKIVNTYGLFAVMTRPRYEIIIEGSMDGENWEEYKFKYKPDDLDNPPRWVQPHQPRVDWQMWFAALSKFDHQSWFKSFIVKLFEGSGDVISLIKKAPFEQPKYLRAKKYKYEFTSIKEKKKTGNWWRREEVGMHMPSMRLD